MHLLYNYAFEKVYMYSRCKVRRSVLTTLLEHGLEIKVYGNGEGWKELQNKYKNLDYNPCLSMLDSLDAMKKHKYTLNDCSFFPDGSHERPFNTLLNGGLPISYESSYLKKVFPADSMLYFNIKSLISLPTKIEILMNKPELAYHMMKNGINIAKNHTWKNRAKEILKIVNTHVSK